MTSETSATAVPPAASEPTTTPFPPIQPVPLSAPLSWLAAGFHDLRRAPAASLAYGAVFAAMGGLIAFVFRHAYELLTALMAGFLLLGPFLATGLYDISRRLERGEPVRFMSTAVAWRSNLGAFSLFALVLTIVMLVWARASLITFALFFSGGMPTLKSFVGQVVSLEHADFVAMYLAVGAVFATVVFAISVVSVPMMLDRGTDTIVAALNSVRALFANPAPLALWAMIIVLVVGAGFATFFVGLTIAVPLIGHATWHAYRALVAETVRDASAVAHSADAGVSPPAS